MTFKSSWRFSVFALFIMNMNADCFGQSKIPDKDSLVSIKFKCIDSLILKIPSGHFHTSFDSYAEGYLYSVIYDDTSSITILCGANAELNLPNKRKDLYSRKEKVKGLDIIYENVQRDKLNIFNAAFDLLKIGGD